MSYGGIKMKLNKKVEIGINAVTALKNREGFVRTKDIAAEVGTTVNFLEQIMRNLRTGGLVKVKRGPGGGYSLNKEMDINAYLVARAVGRFNEYQTGTESKESTVLRQNIVEAFLNTKL